MEDNRSESFNFDDFNSDDFNSDEILENSENFHSIESKPNITYLKNCDDCILNLFNHFFKLFNNHHTPVYVVNILKQYFKDNNINPVNIFQKLINHQCNAFFTSMIGYFGQFGIVKNNRFLGQISLAYLYFSGIGIEENIRLAYLLYYDAAINNFELGALEYDHFGKCL
ncbi:11457_t:CDS:2 [Gigaspora margarita]|uniref:11457_t:CDS:1 n=1 Tax=Gigaspora margarita TaxID=4874 RepID=A0ABN7UPQ2_GIGMA|nr:11457_t:CDS:2 [Gigaspora margarita]